jgi:hypothetical protein
MALGATAGGAHGRRLTRPPSWSTAISGGGLPPAAAAARIRRVRLRTWPGEATFSEKRITPPRCPARMRCRRLRLGCVPANAVMTFCPTILSSGITGASAIHGTAAAL